MKFCRAVENINAKLLKKKFRSKKNLVLSMRRKIESLIKILAMKVCLNSMKSASQHSYQCSLWIQRVTWSTSAAMVLKCKSDYMNIIRIIQLFLQTERGNTMFLVRLS